MASSTARRARRPIQAETDVILLVLDRARRDRLTEASPRAAATSSTRSCRCSSSGCAPRPISSPRSRAGAWRPPGWTSTHGEQTAGTLSPAAASGTARAAGPARRTRASTSGSSAAPSPSCSRGRSGSPPSSASWPRSPPRGRPAPTSSSRTHHRAATCCSPSPRSSSGSRWTAAPRSRILDRLRAAVRRVRLRHHSGAHPQAAAGQLADADARPRGCARRWPATAASRGQGAGDRR